MSKEETVTRQRLYEDTVLNIGPGAQYVKRPKMATIVNAFEGGKTVKEGCSIAASALAEKLTSAKAKENPEGYIRSYLSQLVTAEALEVTDPGTAPEKAEKPKKERKSKKEKAGAAPEESGE